MNIADLEKGFTVFIYAFIPTIFGIICHEVAHGWAAYKLGDPTARLLGRLTLNPLKHVDPMGTAFFVITAFLGPFTIGWAKPVPIQPQYFRHPRQGMMLVAIAGPLANICVALLCAYIVRFTAEPATTVSQYIHTSAQFGLVMNSALALFNLIPFPPLDGSHILAGLLPASLAKAYGQKYTQVRTYGMLILIGLMASGYLGKILSPLIFAVIDTIQAAAGLI